ncbi:MAG: hypothetical protein COB66_05395 [Coxiella sp. (in: Bacteria)]|nr:MAG: hypothetical protein COB66_05395 [Coxiella sp. (in: g-proteobacteria)]
MKDLSVPAGFLVFALQISYLMTKAVGMPIVAQGDTSTLSRNNTCPDNDEVGCTGLRTVDVLGITVGAINLTILFVFLVDCLKSSLMNKRKNKTLNEDRVLGEYYASTGRQGVVPENMKIKIEVNLMDGDPQSMDSGSFGHAHMMEVLHLFDAWVTNKLPYTVITAKSYCFKKNQEVLYPRVFNRGAAPSVEKFFMDKAFGLTEEDSFTIARQENSTYFDAENNTIVAVFCLMYLENAQDETTRLINN